MYINLHSVLTGAFSTANHQSHITELDCEVTITLNVEFQHLRTVTTLNEMHFVFSSSCSFTAAAVHSCYTFTFLAPLVAALFIYPFPWLFLVIMCTLNSEWTYRELIEPTLTSWSGTKYSEFRVKFGLFFGITPLHMSLLIQNRRGQCCVNEVFKEVYTTALSCMHSICFPDL